MEKTIPQLVSLRSLVLRILFAFGIIYIITGFLLRVPEWFLFFSIIIAGLIIYFFIYHHFYRLFDARFSYITSCLLDPELLGREAQCIYSKNSLYWANRFNWLYFESVRLDMIGDFSTALELCESMPAFTRASRDIKEFRLMHFYLRIGELGKATGSIGKIRKLSDNKSYKYYYILLLGSYYLEMGFYNLAQQFLTEASEHAKSKRTKLEVCFALARLYEKESNIEKARSLYEQAAALGPKTWMGHEAARRAEALDQGGTLSK